MSTTVKDLLKKMYAVRDAIPETIKAAIWENQKQIIKLQQQQLYDGKNNKGEDIRPYYSEDSYFSTPGQAKGYIRWKQQITPNSKRNPDAPNLYINGYYHRSLRIADENGNMIIISNLTGKMANDVVDKYDNLLGLYAENLRFIEEKIINPKIWELLAK